MVFSSSEAALWSRRQTIYKCLALGSSVSFVLEFCLSRLFVFLSGTFAGYLWALRIVLPSSRLWCIGWEQVNLSFWEPFQTLGYLFSFCWRTCQTSPRYLAYKRMLYQQTIRFCRKLPFLLQISYLNCRLNKSKHNLKLTRLTKVLLATSFCSLMLRGTSCQFWSTVSVEILSVSAAMCLGIVIASRLWSQNWPFSLCDCEQVCIWVVFIRRKLIALRSKCHSVIRR